MITIVAHGILGTTYRQDVVVDGDGRAGCNLQVLRDIRRQLSSQYGDDTPMTGWALQPSPDGMWLSRIERAFDANYAPAYIMVSFLIPNGQRLRLEAIQLIEHCMITNHAMYMQQSVVLHDACWSFLKRLEPELRGWIEFDQSPIIYRGATSQGSAYWPGDIRSMLENIWDVRFGSYSIIYCGNRILASGKDFARIDNKVVNKPEAQTFGNEGKSIAEPIRVVNEPRLHPLDNEDELLKRHKEAIRLRNLHRVRNSEEEIPRQKARSKKAMLRFLLAVSAVFVVLVVVFLGVMFFGNDNTIKNKASVTVENPDKGSDKLIALKDSLSKNDEMPVVVDDESQNRMKGKQIVARDEKNDSVQSVMKSPSVEKIRIFSPGQLFHFLRWENIKNGETAFYEKYKVDERFRPRVDNIIRKAQEIGQKHYIQIYLKVSHQEGQGNDKLFLLEKRLGAY